MSDWWQLLLLTVLSICLCICKLRTNWLNSFIHFLFVFAFVILVTQSVWSTPLKKLKRPWLTNTVDQPKIPKIPIYKSTTLHRMPQVSVFFQYIALLFSRNERYFPLNLTPISRRLSYEFLAFHTCMFRRGKKFNLRSFAFDQHK